MMQKKKIIYLLIACNLIFTIIIFLRYQTKSSYNNSYKTQFLCEDFGKFDGTKDLHVEAIYRSEYATKLNEWKKQNLSGSCNNVDVIKYKD